MLPLAATHAASRPKATHVARYADTTTQRIAIVATTFFQTNKTIRYPVAGMSNSAFSQRRGHGVPPQSPYSNSNAYGGPMAQQPPSSPFPGGDSGSADPSKSRRRVNDAEQVKGWIRKNQKHIVIWCAMVLVVLFVYHMFSDGDFSFLLTLGSMVRMFAFVILAYFLFTKKSVSGVSFKFLQCYVCVFIFRLSSILNYEGYLPFDRSGDFIYQAFEVLSLVASVGCVFLVLGPYKHTYEKTNDKFGSWHIPSEFGAIYILVPTFILALVFHPSLNYNMLTDVAWTWALCLESVAILPQIVMFMSNGGVVDEWTSHVVASLGLARFFQLVFWISSYHELNDKFNSSPGGEHVGHFVVASQVLQLLLMGDYFYFYIKAMKDGRPMVMHPPVVADAV